MTNWPYFILNNYYCINYRSLNLNSYCENCGYFVASNLSILETQGSRLRSLTVFNPYLRDLLIINILPCCKIEEDQDLLYPAAIFILV